LTPRRRHWWSEKAQSLALAVTVASFAIAVFSLSAIFAVTEGSVDVAETGARGIYAEAALSAAATTRNRAVHAYLIRSAADDDVTGEDALDAATGAIEDGIGELVVRTDRLEQRLGSQEGRETLVRFSNDFVGAVVALVGMLESSGPPAVAVDQLQVVDQRYEALSGLLVAERDDVIFELELASEDAGRIATATRVVVAVLVPIGIVLLLRRILRRRQRQMLLEQELQRQRDAVATKDHFISDLSHQLRTPLTSIVGFASTLLDERVVADPVTTAEFATLIALDAEELSRMVDDLLIAGRTQVGTLELSPRRVDPAGVVEAVLAPLEALGIHIDRDVEPSAVAADVLRLRQVLRDLVSNAIKHGAPPVAVTGSVAGESYHLEVTDRGDGVPEELEARLYERYIHQGRDPLVAGSIGLGLAVSSMLVELMGGELSYQRHDGATVFAVDLPLWPEGSLVADELPIQEEDAAAPSGVLNW
jgi:signal transduction histidine kinase